MTGLWTGHDIAGADELVQFHVVDVAARAELGGVQDDEEVVPVGPDLGHRMLLDAVIGNNANVHLAGHLLEAVIPSPVWRRCRPCRLSSQVEHPKDCGGTR